MDGFSDEVYVTLSGGERYDIKFVPLDTLADLLAGAGVRPGPCAVVTDENVAAHWLGAIVDVLKSWDPFTIVLPAGETTKSAASLQTIYDKVLQRGIDRLTPVIAVGGGVIGDLAGYAAATLLRGLPLVQVPTSLIAQVDSAIGGKTGINHTVGKNLIGAFHQPRIVVIDPMVLQTLPELDWTSGLAEVVKHALIADPEFLDFLDGAWEDIGRRNLKVIPTMVAWAAAIKAKIVSSDILEHGLREVLNFGHTFGHAIERVAGYGSYTHGEAVALGMRAALALSCRLREGAHLTQATSLVRKIPVRHSLSEQAISQAALIDAMRFDKKVVSGRLRLIVLKSVGQPYVTSDVTHADLAAAWEAAYDD